jgi:hypothetical protein
MAWTGVMAQNTSDADYQAALAAITDGGTYRIKTTVSGTDYYVTTGGGLTSVKDNAGYFTITKTSGGHFGTGFRIYGSGVFTNPPLSNNVANLKPGSFSVSTGNDRADWERQILYLNGEGKYAVRSCNCQDATSSWGDAARTHWTYYINNDVVTPCYTYNKDEAYIWEFEGPLTVVNVTYDLYESDGTTLVSSETKKQEANSAPLSPLPGTGSIYNGFFHEKFYFDYTVSGTIGDTDCTLNIVRTEKAGVVKALTDLSNNKAYNIGCDRGAMIAYNGSMVNTALNDAGANAQPYGKFALINYESNYYIFSVDENKFIKNDASVALDLTEVGFGTGDAIVMDPKTAPYFLWHFNTEGKYLNTNGNAPLGYVINTWNTADEGNQYYMVEAADFDPTNALAELEAYFHPSYFVTYVVKDELGNTIFTSEPQPTKLGAKITTLLDEFKRPYYTYNDVDVTIADNQTTIEFTATWNGPFKLSADFANAQWQNMAMRGTWYVTSAVKDDDGAYKTQNANTMGLVEDSYQWAFLGNGYDGFKVINKAEGDGKSFGYGDGLDSGSIPTIMDDTEGHHVWKIVASTNTSVPANSFCLGVPGTDLYINQYGGAGGSLKFWNTTGNIGDAGSAFTVFDVPTNFASFLVEDGIDAEFEATGYFAFTDEAKAALGWDPAYKTDCPFAAYKSLKENLPTAKNDLNNFVLPETGYYTLKNKNYSTYMGIDPSDANMYGNYETAVAAKQIVKLTKNADNTYTIGLMGKFAPATVSQSAQVTANETAGNYTVVIPAAGLAVFKADPSNNMSCLHCAGGGSIVGWEAAAVASQWIVEDAESIQLKVGETGYATAYLPFPVTLAGVYDISVPEALGTWTFDDAANLTAGSGKATLALYGDGVTATDGPDASNGAVSAPLGGGFLLDTHLSEVSSAYTFMFDVSFPDVSGFNCLFQNDVNFDSSKDGSFFIRNGQVGFNSAGLGYKGTINTNEWHRIVVVMDDSRCTLYLDGTKIGGPTSAQDVRAWSMKDTKQFLLFVDNDGEEKVTNAAEIRFWAQALTAEEVAKLGAAGNVPQPLVSDLKAYTASVVKKDDVNYKYLELNDIGDVIPELTGVVLKGTPATYTFTLGGKTKPEGALDIIDQEVDGSEALVKAEANAADNVLKGTLEPIDATDLFILAKPEGEPVAFYRADDGTLEAGKAYIEYDVANYIKAFYFAGEDPTGIANVEKVQVENGTIYNVAGQRLQKMQKGINIVNGKKILF